MKDDVLFSVVVVSYNNGLKWQDALDSVLRQQYPAIELVFCDDCTPNFSLEDVRCFILKRKKANLVRFRLLQGKHNIGTVAMLRWAHSHCHGRYLTQIAGDDAFCDEDVLKHYARALAHKDADVLGVYAGSIVCDNALRPVSGQAGRTQDEQALDAMTAAGQFERFVQGCCIHMGATAFCRAELMAVGDFDSAYRLIEDWPFFLRTTRLGYRYGYIGQKALLYRTGGVTSEAADNTESRRQCYCDHLRLYEREILPFLGAFSSPVRTQVYCRYRRDRTGITAEWGQLSEQPLGALLAQHPSFLPAEVQYMAKRLFHKCASVLRRGSGTDADKGRIA